MGTLAKCENLEIICSQDALLKNSVELCSSKTYFTDAVEEGFVSEMFAVLKKMVSLWKEQNIAESYMLLAQDKLDEATTRFSFQAVPYPASTSLLGRVWGQLVVLWRFIFGGISQDPHELNATYGNLLSQEVQEASAKTDHAAKCAFCSPEVIKSQVVKEGDKVRVLYNYAPIGLGGEKLHFLIVPKEHRHDYTALTPEEHQEAFALSKFVVERLQAHFEKEGQPLRKLYAYHKTGADAGQSVPHWHMHLVLTQNAAQDWLGRLTVLRNILLGGIFSFKISPTELEEKRLKFSHILNY